MIWNLETVREARGLSSSREIRPETMLSVDEQEAVLFTFWSWVVSDLMIQGFDRGLTFSIEDIVVAKMETSEAPEERVMFRAQWAPQTRMVELVGGPMDGTAMEIPKVGEELDFDFLDGPIRPDAAPPTATVLTKRIRYVLAGWEQAKCRWVYRTLPTPVSGDSALN